MDQEQKESLHESLINPVKDEHLYLGYLLARHSAALKHYCTTQLANPINTDILFKELETIGVFEEGKLSQSIYVDSAVAYFLQLAKPARNVLIMAFQSNLNRMPNRLKIALLYNLMRTNKQEPGQLEGLSKCQYDTNYEALLEIGLTEYQYDAHRFFITQEKKSDLLQTYDRYVQNISDIKAGRATLESARLDFAMQEQLSSILLSEIPAPANAVSILNHPSPSWLGEKLDHLELQALPHLIKPSTTLKTLRKQCRRYWQQAPVTKPRISHNPKRQLSNDDREVIDNLPSCTNPWLEQFVQPFHWTAHVEMVRRAERNQLALIQALIKTQLPVLPIPKNKPSRADLIISLSKHLAALNPTEKLYINMLFVHFVEKDSQPQSQKRRLENCAKAFTTCFQLLTKRTRALYDIDEQGLSDTDAYNQPFSDTVIPIQSDGKITEQEATPLNQASLQNTIFSTHGHELRHVLRYLEENCFGLVHLTYLWAHRTHLTPDSELARSASHQADWEQRRQKAQQSIQQTGIHQSTLFAPAPNNSKPLSLKDFLSDKSNTMFESQVFVRYFSGCFFRQFSEITADNRGWPTTDKKAKPITRALHLNPSKAQAALLITLPLATLASMALCFALIDKKVVNYSLTGGSLLLGILATTLAARRHQSRVNCQWLKPTGNPAPPSLRFKH